ncbi:MAG TPA: hypothetical protein VF712_00860 [Thermoleophilaceae bacterium]
MDDVEPGVVRELEGLGRVEPLDPRNPVGRDRAAAPRCGQRPREVVVRCEGVRIPVERERGQAPTLSFRSAQGQGAEPLYTNFTPYSVLDSHSVYHVDSTGATAFHWYLDCPALATAVHPIVERRVEGFALSVLADRHGELRLCERCRSRVEAEQGPAHAWVERAEALPLANAGSGEAATLLARGSPTPEMRAGREPLRTYRQDFSRLRVFADRVEIERPALLRSPTPSVVYFSDLTDVRAVGWIPVVRAPAVELDFVDVAGDAVTERFELDLRDSPELLTECLRELAGATATEAAAAALAGPGEALPWWADVGEWAGEYTCRWKWRFWRAEELDQDEGTASSTFSGSLTLSRRTSSSEVRRWEGTLDGSYSMEEARTSYGDNYWQRSRTTATGALSVGLAVAGEDGGAWAWQLLDRIPEVKGLTTWSDSEGKSGTEVVHSVPATGLWALVDEPTALPTAPGPLGTTSESVEDKASSHMVETVTWSLAPRSAGGGGGPQWDPGSPGGDPKNGPYSPEADHRNPVTMLARGFTPDNSNWVRNAENWLAEGVRYKHWAKLRATYRYLEEHRDIQVTYPEVAEFQQHLGEKLFNL